jgi:hypothetical protein
MRRCVGRSKIEHVPIFPQIEIKPSLPERDPFLFAAAARWASLTWSRNDTKTACTNPPGKKGLWVGMWDEVGQFEMGSNPLSHPARATKLLGGWNLS